MSASPPALGGFPSDGLQALMSGNWNSPPNRLHVSAATGYQTSFAQIAAHHPSHLAVSAFSLGFPAAGAGVGAGPDPPGPPLHPLSARGFGLPSASASGPALLVPAGSATAAPTPNASGNAILTTSTSTSTSTPIPTPHTISTLAGLARQQNQAVAALHSAFASPHYFDSSLAAQLPIVHPNNPRLPSPNHFFDHLATAGFPPPPDFLQPPFFSPLHQHTCDLHALPQILRPVDPIGSTSSLPPSTPVPHPFGHYLQAPNLEVEGFHLRQDLDDVPRDEDSSPADYVQEHNEQDEDLQDDSDRIAVDVLLDDNMPAATTSKKRSRAAASLDSPAGSATVKRPRSQSGSASVSSKKPAKPRRTVQTVVIPDSDDFFAIDDDDSKQHEVFDMTENDILPEEPKVAREDTSTKLCKFECIICLDSASTLTVTHCGHMFCGPCLHQAMHAEVTKKICPMCRQKLETRSKNTQPSKTAKTFFHLEMKLKLSKSQGKQPVRPMRRV